MIRSHGFTWPEILVGFGVIIVLVVLGWPAIAGTTHPGSGATYVFQNIRQLHMATQALTVDNVESNGPINWTCSNSTPLSRKQWEDLIVEGGYLDRKYFQKLVSYQKRKSTLFRKEKSNDVVNVYAVGAPDPGDTLLFASRNWTGPHSTNVPQIFSINAFLVLRKSGEGQILRPKDATNLPLVGSRGQRNYLQLE